MIRKMGQKKLKQKYKKKIGMQEKVKKYSTIFKLKVIRGKNQLECLKTRNAWISPEENSK